VTDPLEDLFHWAAFVAYLEEASACRGWPEAEAVKRRAYAIYEEELREKNARRQQVLDEPMNIRHIVETTPRRE
jgi:hypothetical protein